MAHRKLLAILDAGRAFWAVKFRTLILTTAIAQRVLVRAGTSLSMEE